MKRHVTMLIALVTALLMSPMVATPATAAAILDQNIADGGGIGFTLNSESEFEGQSFTAGRTGLLEKVTMWLYVVGSPTSVTFDLRAADSFGMPTGTILASEVLPTDDLVDLDNYFDVIFSEPASVIEGSNYVLTLSSCVGCTIEDPDDEVYIAWYAADEDPYVYGSAYDWSGSRPDYDFELRTYVAEAQVPDAPTITSVAAMGTDAVTVSFTAPADNGAAINSYEATSSPGGITGSVTQAGSGSVVVSGLQPNTAYTFTLTASNDAGSSASSPSSDSVTTLGEGLVPVFASTESSSSGFTVVVTNFDAAWSWAAVASSGSASVDGSGVVTVTGLAESESATVTVTSSRAGYTDGSASTSGSRAASPASPPASPSSPAAEPVGVVPTPASSSQPVSPTPAESVATESVAETPTTSAVVIDESTVRDFTKSQIALWTGADIRRIDATVFAMLTPAQLRAITPRALASLKPLQFAGLKGKQVAVLAPAQIAALPASVFGRATSRMLSELSPTTVSSLTVKQIKAMSKKSVVGISKAGYARMTPAQQRAMIAAGWRA